MFIDHNRDRSPNSKPASNNTWVMRSRVMLPCLSTAATGADLRLCRSCSRQVYSQEEQESENKHAEAPFHKQPVLSQAVVSFTLIYSTRTRSL